MILCQASSSATPINPKKTNLLYYLQALFCFFFNCQEKQVIFYNIKMDSNTVAEKDALNTQRSLKSPDNVDISVQRAEKTDPEAHPIETEIAIENEIKEEKTIECESKPKKSEKVKTKEVIKDNKEHGPKSPKRKTSFALLFSCGGGKKTIKINMNDAIKYFNTYMTNFNGMINAALCNTATGEIYAKLPNDFNPVIAEIQKTLKSQRTSGEAFVISGEEYLYKEAESKNSIFGHLKSDSVINIGIKFNKKLILLATYSENIDRAKDSFLKCYNEIVQGNDDL